LQTAKTNRIGKIKGINFCKAKVKKSERRAQFVVHICAAKKKKKNWRENLRPTSGKAQSIDSKARILREQNKMNDSSAMRTIGD
jgi:hypothetical protein